MQIVTVYIDVFVKFRYLLVRVLYDLCTILIFSAL